MTRLKAGSILESVLALSLLAGALASGVWIHARTLSTDRSQAMVQAWGVTECLLADPASYTPSSDPVVMDGMEVTVQRETIGGHTVRLTFTCRRSGQVVLERRTIRTVP